jgi:hypothetical protein
LGLLIGAGAIVGEGNSALAKDINEFKKEVIRLEILRSPQVILRSSAQSAFKKFPQVLARNEGSYQSLEELGSRIPQKALDGLLNETDPFFKQSIPFNLSGKFSF